MVVSCATGSIAKRWRELQGEKLWEGLLEPLDMDLRESILSYGELVAATGDGFNNEEHSLHAGLCRYGYKDLLTKSGVAAAGHYEVTKFIYAWEEKKPTWIGYVAVATNDGVAALGRRDIVVAWRGSSTGAEWFKDFEFMPVVPWPVLGPAFFKYPLALVHGCFLSLYTASGGSGSGNIRGSARDQVLEEVKRLMELYMDEETSITIVGHSLGSALAILNAVDLVGNSVNNNNAPAVATSDDDGGGDDSSGSPVTAIVFACPHVGNSLFKDAFDSFNDLRALHVRNKMDPVPRLMPLLPDLGVTLPIDTTLSPYLKDPEMTVHSLQCYLHGVAGEVGDDGKFRLVVDRDVALVNKYDDALKDEYHVPAKWWVPQNKSMVKNDQGKWELKDFEHY